LIVVKLRLAKTVHNIAQKQIELRELFGMALVEVREHLVGDLGFGLWAAGTAAIAGRMKN
jgi:hypothetical protein